MKEIWKPVKNYEGLYEISSHGRVRSLGNFKTKREPKILKPGLRGKGYYHVILSKNKIPKSYSVHRLVAEAFLSNSLNLYSVNHKNKIKTDNRVCNLEWLSTQENTEHGQSKSYKVLHPDLGVIEFFNVSKFIRENNLSRAHFYDMLKGRTKKYKEWTIS